MSEHQPPPGSLPEYRRLSSPLRVGSEVTLVNGEVHTIVRKNAEGDFEAADPYYRWEEYGEIAHAAMGYDDNRYEIIRHVDGTPLAQPEVDPKHTCPNCGRSAHPSGRCREHREEEPPARADGHAPHFAHPILISDWRRNDATSFSEDCTDEEGNAGEFVKVHHANAMAQAAVYFHDELSAARAEAGRLRKAIIEHKGPYVQALRCGSEADLKLWAVLNEAAALPQPTTESR